MNRFRHITFWGLLFGALLLVGCADEDDTLRTQTEKIRSFMTSRLKLVSEEEAMASEEEEQPAFFSELGNTAFRYITNYYDEDRREGRQIRLGSLVQLTLSIYDFKNYSQINANTLPLYTNDPEKLARLEEDGLNITYWPTEPYFVRLGESPMMLGLELALDGCYEGDVVQLYMTYPMAYGDNYIYLVEPESPVAVFFTVDVVFEENN